jgi:hypothetical protein
MSWLVGNEMALHVITAVTSKPVEVTGITKPFGDEKLQTEALSTLAKEFDLLAKPDDSRPFGGQRASNMLDFFGAMRLALDQNEDLSQKEKFFQALALDRVAARTIVETFLPPKYNLGLKPLPPGAKVPPYIAERIANMPLDQVERKAIVERAVRAVSSAVKGIYDIPDTKEHIDPKSEAALRRFILKKNES